MKAKKFTLTLHHSSCRLPKWLHPEIIEDLLPRQQALFKTTDFLEGIKYVGFQFNPKKPLDIAEKLPPTKSGQIKITNLGKNGYYAYLSKKSCRLFRRKKNEDAKIKCTYKNGLVKFYFLPEERLVNIELWFQGKE